MTIDPLGAARSARHPASRPARRTPGRPGPWTVATRGPGCGSSCSTAASCCSRVPWTTRSANEVGAALMTLDAIGDGPVQLQIDSGGGTLAAALALMDIIDVLGVPVRASCVGQAAGPSVGVLAVCSHRLMSAHARLRLLEPSVEVRGNARQLEQLASAHADQWRAFCARLSEATGQPLRAGARRCRAGAGSSPPRRPSTTAWPTRWPRPMPACTACRAGPSASGPAETAWSHELRDSR